MFLRECICNQLFLVQLEEFSPLSLNNLPSQQVLTAKSEPVPFKNTLTFKVRNLDS